MWIGSLPDSALFFPGCTRIGEALYIDAIFRDFVPEEEVGLKRWLQEGDELVNRIIQAIGRSTAAYIYVEIGILQPRHRNRLAHWLRTNNYRVVPILLECRSEEAVAERQAQRATKLARMHDRLKIAIDLDELNGPIARAFVRPGDDDGFHTINTALPIEANIEDICRHIGE